MTNAISTSRNFPPQDATGVDSLRAGAILAGKYRVERVLGSGGMGYVISAVHVTLGQRFAIKILRTDLENEKQEAVARFTREARAAARIESEHVARVVDIGALEDGTPFMVMEYLEGCDLRELVHRRGPLPIEEATDYMLQACEALAEAHAAGIIHRDLKPGNLFLAKRSNAATVLKVLDFGISKYAPAGGDPAGGLTTTNSLMGSPLYMAPEQMRSSKDVDVRADVWAIGTILYELLAGVPAFSGATIPEVCISVMSAQPRKLAEFRSDVPQQLQSLLTKCLSKHREARYPSMAALARELQRFASARAAVHADRASASFRTSSHVNPEELGVHEADRRITERVPPPQPAESLGRAGGEPPTDSLPSLIRSKDTGIARGRSKVLALGLLALAAGTALSVVGGRMLSGPPANAGATAPLSPAQEPPSIAAPLPTGASEIATVPFENLPQAQRPPSAPAKPPAKSPASAPHSASVASAPAPPPPAAVKPAAPAAPVTPKPSNAARTDDWKWGDRN